MSQTGSQVSRGVLAEVFEWGHRLRRQVLVRIQQRARRHQPAKISVVDQPPRSERRDDPPVLRKRKSARHGDAPVAVAVLDDSHLPKKKRGGEIGRGGKTNLKANFNL